MKRRTFLLTAAAAPLCGALPASAAAPWRAKVLVGGFDGTHVLAGLHLSMDHGWKTYWRVPGAGGIPPNIAVTGDNLRAFDVLYPAPQRFKDENGESLGYKDEVVFPILLTLGDPAKAAKLSFNVFLGVCETVCIPVPIMEDMTLAPGASDAAALQVLQGWRGKVPVADAAPLVSFLRAEEQQGRIVLRAGVARPVDDVFVQFVSDRPYFAERPQLEGAEAVMRLLGTQVLADVQGQSVRLTYVDQGKALEQTITIA